MEIVISFTAFLNLLSFSLLSFYPTRVALSFSTILSNPRNVFLLCLKVYYSILIRVLQLYIPLSVVAQPSPAQPNLQESMPKIAGGYFNSVKHWSRKKSLIALKFRVVFLKSCRVSSCSETSILIGCAGKNPQPYKVFQIV